MRHCGKRWATKEDALRSKKGLTGGYLAVPCACEGWHLNPLVLKPVPSWSAKAPKDTGPSPKVRAIVLARDGFACVCCGQSVIDQPYPYDLQHRDARGMGGTSDPLANSPVNLILMLRPHHERVESRIDPEDNAKGYWLRMGESPLLTPVMYFGRDGGFTAWLLPDGGLSFDEPASVTI